MSLPILTRDRPLLADGAMATTLFDRGLRLGDPAELWNSDHPAQVLGVQRDFVAAGAGLLLTNSFGGHPWRLRTHGIADRVTELNSLAAAHARAAASAATRPVLVAGAVGPTGARTLTAEMAAGFAAQMAALAAGGVDLIWIETMSDPDEMRVAAEAAAATGLPYGLTASFDAAGRTLGGLDAAAVARHVASFPVLPVAIGVNCGAGIAPLLRDVAAMRSAAPRLPVVAKASAGLPQLRDGRLIYPLTPEHMAAYARAAVMVGARIVGGCCGTTPAHIDAMSAALGVHTSASGELAPAACTA